MRSLPLPSVVLWILPALLGAVATAPALAEKDGAANDVRTLAEGNADFAFRLFRAAPKGMGDLFLSPYGVSEAMAMATAGARDATAAALLQGMRYGLDAERLPPAFHALRAEVARPTNRRWPHGLPLRLQVTNGFWVDRRFPLRPEYASLLERDFAAQARTANFRDASEDARRDINAWVRERTARRIAELLRQGDVGADTLLVLVNAIRFKAWWKFPFLKEYTRPGPFTRLDGTMTQVSSMMVVEKLRYAEGEDWQLVELPYSLSHASMTILLPKSGAHAAFEKRLDAATWKRMSDAARHRTVRLRLPRTKVRSRLVLSDLLAAMGMAVAFSPDADFSGVSAAGKLFLSEVVHEATLEMDEYGTEATAATAVVLDKGKPPEPVEMRVDRPFLVLVRNTVTGAILFLGRVADPGAAD